MIQHAPRVRRHDALDRERPPTRDDRERSVRVPIRTKLVVGHANDPAERDADVMASEVMRRLERGDTGDGGARVRPGSGRVMRSTVAGATVGFEGGAVDADLDRDIRSATGAGAPGSDDVLRRMGDAFGTDLGGVSIHTGGKVDRAAERLQARAFAVGDDVYIRRSDYRPGTSDGDRLIAHELAHTMQGDTGTVGRKVIRRLLIPKVDNAFTDAIAANSHQYFTSGRANTDKFVNKTDQEELARVHGRGHVGKDSADKEKVANMVRAVVLSEYSARLQNLEEGIDEKTGAAYAAADKPRKRATYKAKSEEFRQKHIPLVAKGSTAPETQGFLREYGLDGAFGDLRAATAKKKGAQPARIDVRATFIGGPVLGMKLRAHLFIVYTGTDGRQMYFRGGPDNNDFTVAEFGDYVPDTVDWDPSAPSVTIAEGQEAEIKLDKLIEATSVIDAMKVPYQAAVGKQFGGANPNSVQKLASMASAYTSGDGENCNATAWTILTRAGLAPKKPGGVHPGWGKPLGSHTADTVKQPMAAPEVFGTGKPYTLDASRERVDSKGTIQVYRDRVLHQPLYKVAPGTKVQLLGVSRSGVVRIMINGELGYVERTEADMNYERIPTWIHALYSGYSDDELQEMVDDPDDPLVEEAADRVPMPEDWVPKIAAMVLSKQSTTSLMLIERLDAMGEDRVEELLTNPDEAGRVAKATGQDLADVQQVIKTFVGEKTLVAKLPGALKKQINRKDAANQAVNEHPNYTTIKAIAADLGVNGVLVAKELDKLRPPEHQGTYLHQLLRNDVKAQMQVPNVDRKKLAEWADTLGVKVVFLKKQLALLPPGKDSQAKAPTGDAAKLQAPAKPTAAKPVAQAEPVPSQPKLSEVLERQLYGALMAIGYGMSKWAADINDEDAKKAIEWMGPEGKGITVADVIKVAQFYFKPDA